MDCSTCDWHGISTETDDDGFAVYTWLCWRDCGSPCGRKATRLEDSPPPACADYWQEV